jgi:hypothetical protein
MKPNPRSICSLAALLLATAGLMRAQTEWAGSNSNWFDANNWNPVGIPNGSTTTTLSDNSSVDIDGGLGAASTAGLMVGGTSGTSTLNLFNGATLGTSTAIIGQKLLRGGRRHPECVHLESLG